MELEIDPSGIAITDTTTNTNNVAIDSSNIDISGTHKITLNDTNGISINNLTLQPTNTLGSATNITIDELAHLSGVSSNIQTQFNLLKGDAPAALDTIAELADAIGDNANFVTDINTNIAAKVGKTGDETISGIKTIQGSLNFDTTGTISGDVIPVNNNLTNIGSASKQINAIHANDVNVTGNIHMNGNIDICGGNFTITNEELSKLDGVSDNIQSQINTAIAGNVWDNSGVKIHYNSGNVGIGTNDPTGKLEVHDGPIIIKPGANATNALQFHSGSGNANYTNDIAWYDSNGIKKVMIGSSSNDNTGHFRFWENMSQDFTFINDASNTKVGINRVDPQYNLDVSGDINLTGTLYQNGSEFNPSLWSESTGNVYRSSGNVGIGLSTPEKELHIYTTNQDNGATILLQSDGGNGGIPESSIHFKTSADAVDSTASTWDSGRIYSSWHSDGDDWNNSYIALQTHGTNTSSFTNDLVVKGGYVGIGTTNPRNKLEVINGNISVGDYSQGVTGSRFVGVFDTTTNPLCGMEIENTGSTYYQKLHLRTHGSANNGRRLTIDEGGNVGIGDTTPAYKLDVAGDVNFTGNLYQNGSLFSSGGGSSSTLIGPFKLISTGRTNENAWGHFQFERKAGTVDYGAIGFGTGTSTGGTNVAEAICVKRTGEVGIGTNAPESMLQLGSLAQNSEITGPSSSQYKKLGLTSPYHNSGFYFATRDPNWNDGFLDIGFNHNGSDSYDRPNIMSINLNGKVGIGTTNPSKTLDVAGDINFTGTLYQNGSAFSGGSSVWSEETSWVESSSTKGVKIEGSTSITPGSQSPEIFFLTSYEGGWATSANTNPAVDQWYAAWNDTLTGISDTTATGFSLWADYSIKALRLYQPSDIRIKRDISMVDDNEALTIVNNIETMKYNYKDIRNMKQTKTYGFLAQNVREHLPNAVSLQTEYIPDITKHCYDCSWNQTESGNWKVTIDEPIDISSNMTGNVKIFAYNISDISNSTFNENSIAELNVKIEDDNQSFILDKKHEHIFIFGREINDFHFLDKEQVFAVHHSAIQELSKKNDALNTEKETMQTQITTLLEENNSMKSRLEALEAAIINLQNN